MTPCRSLLLLIASRVLFSSELRAQSLALTSRATFNQAFLPEPYQRLALPLTTSKQGVKIGPCAALKNKYTDEEYFTYALIGLVKHAPAFALIEKSTYSGVSYLLLNTATCQQSHLRGLPYKRGSLLICFNEAETTDRRDSLFVYRLQGTNVQLLKRQALSKDQLHDENQPARFSKDGKYVYYRTRTNRYLAYKL